MSLLDEDKLKEKKPAHERRALPGEEIDRTGVGWVKNYDKLMAKEELEASRERREKFEKKFVDFPDSWWPNMNTRDQKRLHLDGVVRDVIGEGQYDDTWSVRDNHENPALSQFPSKLAKQILRMWSLKNDRVFDPFAGHLTRPIMTNHFNRDYWGCDVSIEYFDTTKDQILSRTEGGLLDDEIVENRSGVIDVDLQGNRLRLENRDSRTLDSSVEPIKGGETLSPIPTKWADFVITSPPYFDLENYGDEDEQLGIDNDEFEDFMDDMRVILEHTHDILKPYRYAAFVVNDFRDGCRFKGLIPYHMRLIQEAINAGFQLHDIAMYPTGKSASMFTHQLTHMEVTGKIHEYVIVFRRWPDEWEGSSRKWDWKYRGLHWDIYSPEWLVDDYGEERVLEWVEERKKRDLPVDRWVDDEGNLRIENDEE